MVFLRFEELRFFGVVASFHAHLEGHLEACLSLQSRVQSTSVVSSYVMAKNIKHKRVVVGARVQLKNDLTTDGKVQSVAGKAKWTVRWDEGPLKGTVVAQSSKSLRLWQVDLSAFDAGEAMSGRALLRSFRNQITNTPKSPLWV